MKLKKHLAVVFLLVTASFFFGDTYSLYSFRNYVSFDSAQTVVEKYFQYTNEYNRQKILSTLTDHLISHYDSTAKKQGDIIKIISIKEETNAAKKAAYLSLHKGRLGTITEDGLKTYKVNYAINNNDKASLSIDTNTLLFYVIRKNKFSPWLIDSYTKDQG